MNNLKTQIRRIIYITLGSMDKLLGRENNLVIFAYHNIINDPWVFNVSLKNFAKQINYLSTVGNFISLNDLREYFLGKNKFNKKSFLITFDDGYKRILSTIKITKKYQISPIVFALGNEAYVDRDELKTKSDLLSKSELKKLISEGWTIGSHGLTHAKLTKIGDELVKKEISESKLFLQNKTNQKINSFAYPHGKYNKKTIKKLAESGYDFGFTMDDGIVTKKTNRFAIPRVGVMGTHSDLEFKYIASPSVIGFRKLIKKTFLSKLI